MSCNPPNPILSPFLLPSPRIHVLSSLSIDVYSSRLTQQTFYLFEQWNVIQTSNPMVQDQGQATRPTRILKEETMTKIAMRVMVHPHRRALLIIRQQSGSHHNKLPHHLVLYLVMIRRPHRQMISISVQRHPRLCPRPSTDPMAWTKRMWAEAAVLARDMIRIR